MGRISKVVLSSCNAARDSGKPPPEQQISQNNLHLGQPLATRPTNPPGCSFVDQLQGERQQDALHHHLLPPFHSLLGCLFESSLIPTSASCKELSRAVCNKINEVVQRQESVPLPAAPAPAAGQSTRATARHRQHNRKPNRTWRSLGGDAPSCSMTLSPSPYAQLTIITRVNLISNIVLSFITLPEAL